MKYSISEIASLLGISIVTIRNYEKSGLIEPVRNEQNNYRQYNATDVNLIRRLRSYMGYGFSIAEANDIMFCKDLAGMARMLHGKEEEIRNRLEFDYYLLSFVKQHANYLERISESIGECVIENSPAFYAFIYRENLQVLEDSTLHELARKWGKYRPFVESFHYFFQHCFEENRLESCVGLCIESQYAQFFGIKEEEPVVYYPPRRSIHAIIQHTYEPDIDYSKFEFFFVSEWAKKRGVKIVGDAIGRVLHTSKSTGEWRHYIEIWAPIE